MGGVYALFLLLTPVSVEYLTERDVPRLALPGTERQGTARRGAAPKLLKVAPSHTSTTKRAKNIKHKSIPERRTGTWSKLSRRVMS